MHDSNSQPNKGRPSGREQRSVFHAATLFDPYASSYDDDVDPDDSAIFDADTDISGLQAYYSAQRREKPVFPPGSRMPIARWKLLPETAKKIWDQLTDSDKAIILSIRAKQHGNSHAIIPITDLSPGDLEDDLLAMVSKQSNRNLPSNHPGDIRKVLGQAPNPTSKKGSVQIQDQ